MENNNELSFHDQVFEDGRNAALAGKPMSDNPHNKGQWRGREQRLADLWFDGWMAGKHPSK